MPVRRYLLVVTLALLAFVPAFSAAADNLKCGYCGQVIASGQYLKIDNQAYHPDCYNDHLAPRCAVCNQTMTGQYVVYGGQEYHAECYESNIALRCAHCGEIIEGDHLVDYWGQPFHTYHQGNLPDCAFCGRLLSDSQAGGGQPFDDRHQICNQCRSTAITETNQARRHFDETRRLLERIGLAIDYDDINLELVSKAELRRLSPNNGADNFGLTLYETSSFGGLIETREFTVYILQGLPTLHFVSTAAHELMHVWIDLEAPEDPESQLREGSCNYAARLVLERTGGDLARFVIAQLDNNPDPVYGDGYRRVTKLVRNRGFEYLLDHLRFDPEFPIGY